MENYHSKLLKTQIWKYLGISLLCIASCTTSSKITEVTPIESIKETLDLNHIDILSDLDFFEIDKFENIYWVSGNKLFLKDLRNQRDYLYENDRLGTISSIDVGNPQKILVFYDDYDIALTLDNTLSERSQIDLKSYNITDINAIALSNDNNLWIYDPIGFQLKKIDERGNTLAQSLNMLSYYLDQIEPTKIIESQNIVYLLSAEGILLFDNLGQYIKILPFENIQDFQVRNEQIIYLTNRGAFNYSIKQLAKFQIEGLDESRRTNWKQIRVGDDNFYIGYNEGIEIVER